MEFRILGPLEARSGGEPIDLGPPKQRALLALLLLHVDRVVPTDRILDELWGDDAAGKEKALWVHISRLRSALEPHRAERGESSVLVTRDHGYLIRADPAAVDAHRFEAAVARRPPTSPTTRRGGRDPARRARPVARFGAAGLRLRRLRPGGDRPARGAATRGDRDAHRRRPAARTRVRARRRAGDVGVAASAARAPGGPVDARPLPSRATSRGAACIPAVPPRTRRGARDRAVTRAVPARGTDPAARPPSCRRPSAERAAADACDVNPFKGLHAFREADADDFFGRDRLVAEVIARVGRGCPAGRAGRPEWFGQVERRARRRGAGVAQRRGPGL